MFLAWQLMTPTLGGTIDPTFLAEYDATVQAALSVSTKPYVIIDLVCMYIAVSLQTHSLGTAFQHNYARWNGGIIGQGGPTNAQFASIWSQLATKYAGTQRIIASLNIWHSDAVTDILTLSLAS